jgi:hypothetical protein
MYALRASQLFIAGGTTFHFAGFAFHINVPIPNSLLIGFLAGAKKAIRSSTLGAPILETNFRVLSSRGHYLSFFFHRFAARLSCAFACSAASTAFCLAPITLPLFGGTPDLRQTDQSQLAALGLPRKCGFLCHSSHEGPITRYSATATLFRGALFNWTTLRYDLCLRTQPRQQDRAPRKPAVGS